jgi:hypothetical protein
MHFMTTFPGSPRVLKGALVSFDLPDPTPNVIVFQYNPVTLTRTLQAQMAGGEGERAGAMRFKGAPVETISLDVEIDATDQLEKADATATSLGIYPQLAGLETLLYPDSDTVISNLDQLSSGIIEIVPPLAPFTLFVYGPKRILPVQVTDFRVTEEAHDINLNPVRAKVSLGLRVLSYDDLLPDHPGHALFLAHQVAKEAMARAGVTHSLDAVGVSNIKLL